MADRGGPHDPWSGWGSWATGFAISVYLLSALAVWGLVGYLVDRLLGNDRKVFTGLGMMVGAVAGIYLIYLRYGRQDDQRR